MATSICLPRTTAVRATSVVTAIAALMLSGAAHPASAVPQASGCKQPVLVNGSFENPEVRGIGQLTEADVPGWRTTDAHKTIEIWSDGFDDVPAYDGNQFAEINATSPGTLFQEVRVKPGQKLRISFAHRGRAGVDTLRVAIGEPGGRATSLGIFKTGNEAWKAYTVEYTVRRGQTSLLLGFTAIASAGGPSVGNFLDGVKIKAMCGCGHSHTSSSY